jgi:non-canonical poly(A) RNA polymerase PAPD5/7
MGDSYRPSPPKSEQSDHRQEYANGGTVGQTGERYQLRNRRGQRRAQGTFLSRAAERPFLRTHRSPTPELMPGMEEDDKMGIKFRAIDDMSDSDEAEMDLSSDEGQQRSDGDQPKKKQARTDLDASKDGESIPKWSNPDPYTALPPVDDSQRKKLDVVKLIRKARMTNSSDSTPKPNAIADDFISFDFDDEVKTNDKELTGQGMPGAPTGPRAKLTPQEPWKKSKNNNQIKLDTPSNPALGNRKRNINDEIKDEALSLKKTRKEQAKGANGDILPKWRVDTGQNATPWYKVDHAATLNMGHW